MSPRRSVVPPQQQMQEGPSQSQIEIEHHKNLLIGLNEKLTVFNDLKHDLET
jgi:helix-turn-helix protein